MYKTVRSRVSYLTARRDTIKMSSVLDNYRRFFRQKNTFLVAFRKLKADVVLFVIKREKFEIKRFYTARPIFIFLSLSVLHIFFFSGRADRRQGPRISPGYQNTMYSHTFYHRTIHELHKSVNKHNV